VPSVKLNNPALTTLGTFKPDDINVGELAKNAAKAQKLFDRAGWR
jgi:iron(III) transport system substrate-binding protein